jgi:hypothetical protein
MILSEESLSKQREKARTCLVIKFNGGRVWKKWSNEFKQPDKIKNMKQSVDKLKWLFAVYWKKNAESAAIFDTREHKTIGSHNKIYQYENGEWFQVNYYE